MLQLVQVGKVGHRLRHLSDVVEKKLLPATAETCLQTLPAVLLAWYQKKTGGTILRGPGADTFIDSCDTACTLRLAKCMPRGTKRTLAHCISSSEKCPS